MPPAFQRSGRCSTQHLKEKHYDLSSLHTLLVGGAAASRTMLENYSRDFGITVLHAWGMTETSPIGTVSRLKSSMENWPEEEQIAVRLKQGIPVAGVEACILDDGGRELRWTDSKLASCPFADHGLRAATSVL